MWPSGVRATRRCKDVMQLLKKEKYGFPANMELEYRIPEGSNIVAEAKKCFAYVKSCLA